MERPFISVITCSISPEKFQAVSDMYATLFSGEGYEMIGIHDAQSLAEGYNRGFDRSRGDIVIFCHDDIEILTPHFASRLRRHMGNCDLLGVAGTQRAHSAVWHTGGYPYIHGQVTHLNPDPEGSAYLLFLFGVYRSLVCGIQQLDGLFMACRREVAAAVRFDEERFDAFHGYDADFSFGAHLAGFRLGVATDIPIIHRSLGDFNAEWTEYARRFQAKYADKLTSFEPYRFDIAVVAIQTKAQVIQLMEEIAAQVCPD